MCNIIIEIQELTKGIEWRHVGTHDNPADVISRGILPSEIRTCAIWWTGPSFLHQKEPDWPAKIQHLPAELLPETKSASISLTVTEPQETFILFTIESSYRRMQRIMALVLRFIDHIRRDDGRNHRYGPVTIHELEVATKSMTSITQKEAFPKEFHYLESNQVIYEKSLLIAYSVSLDKSQFYVMWVGGRIRHAWWMRMDQRHPMVLPSTHPFTHAVIRAYHTELLHAPQQLLLNALLRRFYVVHGRSTVRWVIRRCVTCFRAKPVAMQQMMGDLPWSRLEGGYLFRNTGVDFCGPVYIRQHNKRSTVTYKAYVAVFVCLPSRRLI